MFCFQGITCDTTRVIRVDTIRVVADSITNDALLKSQELYNTSFTNIQGSFSSFVSEVNVIVVAIGITVSIISIIIGLFSFINFRNMNDLRKEIKKDIEKQRDEFVNIKKRISNLENKLNNNFGRIENKFKEIKEQFYNQKRELHEITNELVITQTKNFYHFLKMKFPTRSNAYLEINIKSKTFIKTEKYKRYEFKYCKIIDSFDERTFKITVGSPTKIIPYSKVKEWCPDDYNPQKINIELNMAIVLYENENRLELEDFFDIEKSLISPLEF